MKKNKKNFVIEELTRRVIEKLEERTEMQEGTGFDSIFTDLKSKIPNISILPDNVIDASEYKEHEIVDALKSIGYTYKKPMSGKLHFFNKKTSISLYLIQSSKKITLMP
jgi:hypothetical protein